MHLAIHLFRCVNPYMRPVPVITEEWQSLANLFKGRF